MNAAPAELRAIVSSFRITGPASFSLLGRDYSATDEEGVDDGPFGEAGHRLLHTVLYNILHCRSDARGISAPIPFADPHGAAKFVAALSAANCGRGRSARCRVSHRFASGVIVDYWGILFAIESREAKNATDDVVELQIPKEQQNVAPRFYVALSDRGDEYDERPKVRVYWHVDASGATTLVRSLTRGLNDAGIAFRLKILSDPRAYSRADAATLYLAADDFSAATPILEEARRVVAEFLYSEVSLFALKLADGVSLAEDPGNDRSFGEDRSERLARALASVAREWDLVSEQGFVLLMRQLATSGTDSSRMHLNPGSTNSYRWSPAAQ